MIPCERGRHALWVGKGLPHTSYTYMYRHRETTLAPSEPCVIGHAFTITEMYFRIWKFEDSLAIVIIYSCFDKPGYLDLKLISLLAGPFNTSNLICHLLKMRALDSIAKKQAIPTVVLFEIG